MGYFWGLDMVQKHLLGSTHVAKQILFSKFCSLLSHSYLSWWVGGWLDYYDIKTTSAKSWSFSLDFWLSLAISYHFQKTRCPQTDRPTDRQTLWHIEPLSQLKINSMLKLSRSCRFHFVLNRRAEGRKIKLQNNQEKQTEPCHHVFYSFFVLHLQMNPGNCNCIFFIFD